MEVLRDNRESLMAVLEAFVYDPLIAWRLTATDKRPGGVGEVKDLDDPAVYGKQRKNKANETEILNGKSIWIVCRISLTVFQPQMWKIPR